MTGLVAAFFHRFDEVWWASRGPVMTASWHHLDAYTSCTADDALRHSLFSSHGQTLILTFDLCDFVHLL